MATATPTPEGSFALAYAGVLAAWSLYLENDILIGHSGGAPMLTVMIARELDGRPAQSKLISALLLGTNLAVPKDSVVAVFPGAMYCQRNVDSATCPLTRLLLVGHPGL